MFWAVKDSAETNMKNFSSEVEWLDWKAFLGNYFTIPATMKLIRYHVFFF